MAACGSFSFFARLRKCLDAENRTSAAKLAEQLVDVREVRGLAGLVFRLSLVDLGQEELSAEQLELPLIALKPLRAHDVCGRTRALEDDHRLVVALDVVDHIGNALPELRNWYALHYGRMYEPVYVVNGVERVKIFIEVEAGSDLRHVYDAATFELLSTRRMPRPYPFPYGFIVGTTTADGDAVDCYVLTQRPIPTGTLVEGEPAGLLEQFEDGEVDHKVLATLPGEVEPSPADVEGILSDFIAALFRPHPMIRVEVGRILDADQAVAFIAASRTDDPAH
jgi:inorganic pyrophosphatase